MLALLLLNRMNARRRVRHQRPVKLTKTEGKSPERIYCRTCLNTEDLVSIFYNKETERKRSHDLKLVTGLEIKMDDGLSQKICTRCLETMNMALQFRRTSKKSEKALLNMISGKPKKKYSSRLQKALKPPVESTMVEKVEMADYSYEIFGEQFQDHDDGYDVHVNSKQKMMQKQTKKKRSQLPNCTSYKCATCNKVFHMKATYKAHIRLHTNYCVCETCGKRCRNNNQLQEHKRARHGLYKIHKCAYCEYSSATKEALTRQFNLPESTYYKSIKSKDSIKSECSDGHGNIKRTRVSEFPNIEKCLLEWIKQTLDKNIPIDEPLLKEKSKEFATKLGIQNFSASNGWLEGFKRRHDIAFKKAAGESKSVDQGVCNHWTKDLPNLLEGYKLDDIYNADETCVNMSGTDKLPLLIIGKSKRPRCFKGVKTLPVDYANNTKAWMTKILFKDWLKKVDKQMKINRKKILLFIDNCAAHTDLPTLANVKVMFLPANTTSKLQPLDQGIIHTFKRFYRKEVVKHILTSLEENNSSDINVLLAMKFARKAWYLVNDVTVKNCFKKAGFRKSTDEQDLPEENDVEVGPSNEEWTKLVSHESNMLMPSFEDFVQIDDDVTTAGEQTDGDIIKNCVNTCIAGNDSEDEAQIPETEIKIIPMKLALNALETVHQYFEYAAIHERRHTGERPYVCDHCGATFHRRSNLVQHIAIHLPEKNFQCDMCPKRLKSRKFLQIHKHNAHTGKRYGYLCSMCGHRFEKPNKVRAHTRRVHGVPDEQQGPIARVQI
ncbi:unnamed protein product [Arctia plantaginis]|uniref:Uncharacterized protein n=1 Tax=Arctia plantaginis TaxID=874455 RepID=A0A8S1AV77_ARCPL|nr:unnamed protein product [Arctia plantaginis]